MRKDYHQREREGQLPLSSGCHHFDDGRTCRGCEYSSDPDLFDGCCLYGHPDAQRRTAQAKVVEKG